MSRPLTEPVDLDRETLELLALEYVCACRRYYDLADCLEATTSDELLAIIEDRGPCPICHGRF